MLSKDELPEDPAQWGDLAVSFPRLVPDTADSCPASLSDLLEYIDSESANAGVTARLRFLRTAQVGDKQCWIWSYTDADGELSYITYWQDAAGEGILGMSDAKADPDASKSLSPEQYILAEYHDLVYW